MAPTHPPANEQANLMQQRGEFIVALRDAAMPERTHTAHAVLEIPGSMVREVERNLAEMSQQVLDLKQLPLAFRTNPVATLGKIMLEQYGPIEVAIDYLNGNYSTLFPGDKESPATRLERALSGAEYSTGERERILDNFDRLCDFKQETQEAKEKDRVRQQMMLENPLDPNFKAELVRDYLNAFYSDPLSTAKKIAFGPINTIDTEDILNELARQFNGPCTALEYLLQHCRETLGYDENKLNEVREFYANYLR